MITETWKDVIGYEGIYQVSNIGRIRSLDRVTCHGHKRRGVILSSKKGNNGYEKVILSKGNNKSHVSTHRIVAETFLIKDRDNFIVNHKDGNKLNNDVTNLEWVSNSYNIQHAFDNGLNHGRKGMKHHMAKLNDLQVRIIKKSLILGVRLTDLASIFNVSIGTISNIKNGNGWSHV
jgi:hypothetical protein